MTDPMARDNFEKFGNPDGYGRGQFHVSVALPKSINEPQNQIFVLVVFFVVVIIIIPGFFYKSLEQEETDVGQVSLCNRKRFAYLIDEKMTGAVVPGILGQGFEFKNFKVKN